MRLGRAGPVANHFEVFLLPGREEKQHPDIGDPFVAVGRRKILRDLPDDLIRLGTIQRPGLAVGSQNGNFHRHRLRYALNGQFNHAICSFGFCQNLSQLNPRIDIRQLFPVDPLDDLPLLQLPGLCGRRTFLDILHPHREGWLNEFDANPHRTEAIDRLQRLLGRRRRREKRGLFVKWLLSRGQANKARQQNELGQTGKLKCGNHDSKLLGPKPLAANTIATEMTTRFDEQTCSY